MGTLLGLYKVNVSLKGQQAPINLTQEGRQQENPDRYLGGRGLGIGRGISKCATIALSEWWSISSPGEYTVSISHLQIDPVKNTSFVVKAPDFKFSVVAK